MSIKEYKVSLGIALLLHVIVIFSLTKIVWSDISKVGWEKSHVIQSYLYKPHKSEVKVKPKAINLKLKPNADWINRNNQSYAKADPHKAILKSNLTRGQYNKLLIELHNAIEQNQIYPANARLLREHGTVTMGFKLFPSGQIVNIKVLKSSGYRLLDQAAVQAVTNSSPFKSVKLHEAINLTLELEFKTS